MELVGALTLPVLIGIIVAAGIIRKVDVFDVFLDGAKDGMMTLVRLLPTLAGMLIAIEMFNASGALDVIVHSLSPLANALGIPSDTVPLAILRPLSGSGSLALTDSIIGRVGVESLSGRVAAVMCGASETTFYTIAIYYGSCNISKIRYTLPAALLADLAAAIFSSLFVRILFA